MAGEMCGSEQQKVMAATQRARKVSEEMNQSRGRQKTFG